MSKYIVKSIYYKKILSLEKEGSLTVSSRRPWAADVLIKGCFDFSITFVIYLNIYIMSRYIANAMN